jgi:hypothetical protein
MVAFSPCGTLLEQYVQFNLLRSVTYLGKAASEANIVHIDDIVGNRNPSTSTEEKPKKTRRRKHKTLEDVHKAIRDREDPYGVGHRRGVSVGAGKASKSKNILPHFDVDPRYAIVL